MKKHTRKEFIKAAQEGRLAADSFGYIVEFQTEEQADRAINSLGGMMAGAHKIDEVPAKLTLKDAEDVPGDYGDIVRIPNAVPADQADPVATEDLDDADELASLKD